jgi:hypothetical protein
MLDGDELLQANRPGESDPCLLEPGLKSMEIAVADGFAHTRLSHHHDPLLGGLCRDDVADGVRAATRRHSRGEDPHRPTRGVIMTGMLSDGSAGFIAVRSGGRLTVVQDPADAANPMGADHCRRLEQIPRRVEGWLAADRDRDRRSSRQTIPTSSATSSIQSCSVCCEPCARAPRRDFSLRERRAAPRGCGRLGYAGPDPTTAPPGNMLR